MRVCELAEALGVAPGTVRRDIAQLANEGLLSRMYGGTAPIKGAAGDPLAGDSEAGTESADSPIVRTIGMLVPSLDYCWTGVVRGAEEEARARGMRIVLRSSSCETEDERPQFIRLVRMAGADGLLLAPNVNGEAGAATVACLVESKLPVVRIERSATVAPLYDAMESGVGPRPRRGVAVRHLVGLGHKRVGLVASKQSPTARHVRACRAGFFGPREQARA